MKIQVVEFLIREVTDSVLHPNSLNREEGFSLSRSWKPLIEILKKQKKGLIQGKEPYSCLFCPSFNGPFKAHLSWILSTSITTAFAPCSGWV
jgi:hypothetical protein